MKNFEALKYLTMERNIKILLALLLLLCLADMPYGFYQLVRFVAMIGFVWLAWQANGSGKNSEAFIYIALALLFQPLIKISLGRALWNFIDVVVGVGLLISILAISKEKQND